MLDKETKLNQSDVKYITDKSPIPKMVLSISRLPQISCFNEHMAKHAFGRFMTHLSDRNQDFQLTATSWAVNVPKFPEFSGILELCG